MSFLSGRVSFVRFKVSGRPPRHFGPEHLERLAARAIGKQRIAAGDGIDAGWTATDHVLDTRFELAKNIVNDTLQFELRLDQQRIPGDMLRAYTQVELEGLAASNPSGRPSTRQRREARERARERLEHEARDGRFIKRKTYPLLWDCLSGELFAGSTAAGVLDRLQTLFQHTFDHKLEWLGAGRRAFLLAESREQTRGVDDAGPAQFGAGSAYSELAWLPDETSRDFLGNEFLLWLWYHVETEGDEFKLADESILSLMLTRTLVLECPRGETGRESISSDAPSKLPEARRAIQSGKLPRKLGMMLVRHDKQYELSLQGESLAVSGARLPAVENEDPRVRLEERIANIRHLAESLDLLFDRYVATRVGQDWPRELALIKRWLHREERERQRGEIGLTH